MNKEASPAPLKENRSLQSLIGVSQLGTQDLFLVRNLNVIVFLKY